MAKAENELTKSCINYMRLHNVFCWRQNNGGVFDPKTKQFRSKRKSVYDINGIPDIIGILPNGKLIGVEVKGPKTRQSEMQKIFQIQCHDWDISAHKKH